MLVFVGIVAVMDYVLLNYLISHGLEAKSYRMQIGNYQLPIPLLGLTYVGVLIVAIAAWRHMSGTMPIAALKEMSQLETIRLLRAAGIALFFFSTVLFGPYIIGGSAFWAQLSSLSRVIPQFAGPLQGLLSSIRPAMELDALTKLAVSQNIAAGALVAVSGVIGYVQRRIRRTR
jgi:hypothetical protein